MLPEKTIKYLKNVYGLLCSFGSLPYTYNSKEQELFLEPLSCRNRLESSHYQMTLLSTLLHTSFLVIRLIQAYFSVNRKFFLMFMHLTWTMSFILISWLHGTLVIAQSQIKAYLSGLLNFYGSDDSMPGEKLSAKRRRRCQKKPCLIDILVVSFFVGGFCNVLTTVMVFLRQRESYQFAYSTLPHCWKKAHPSIIIPFLIYEIVLPGINWAVLLFFIIIHLVHLLCTRDYLLMLRKNTRGGILKLDELLHYYRSIQILHNHYNQWIASFMPVELLIVISLTLAGNIGMMRTLHLNGHVSIPEIALFPIMSVLTGAFQLIFYTRAGDLHHLSSYFSKRLKKTSFGDVKLAKLYLESFPPLCVQVGNVLKIQKFTIVRVFGAIVVSTARLSVLFFDVR